MSTLVAEVRAQNLVVTEDNLIVDLSDGRSITVPWLGTRDSFTGHPMSATTGDGLATEREFIGPIWTKTSALRT